jgi:hypothetical protein
MLSHICGKLAFLLLALCLPLHSSNAHEHHHPAEHAQLHADFYSKLQRPDAPADAMAWQKSCCSDRDCRPAQARFNDGHWEYLQGTQWMRVPDAKIVSDRPPDMQAHVCISEHTGQLFCFVRPDYGL